MEGMTLGHVFKPSLSSLRKALSIVDYACPVEIKAVHVLNTSQFLNVLLGNIEISLKSYEKKKPSIYFLAIIKPIIRSDILNRVFFHTADMDYEKFYKDCIPKSCLPADYGGDLKSIQELHDKHSKSLLELSEYFLLEERMINFEFENCDFDAESCEIDDVKF